MYFYTYKITCTKGSYKGKIYFGQHRTENLEDGYIAGGRKINAYLKKYPNGYEREILQFYNSQDELNNAEYELIKPHLGKEYCLNLVDGGGVFTIDGYVWNKGLPKEKQPRYGKINNKSMRTKISEGNKKHAEEYAKSASIRFKGKTPWNKGLTKETDERIQKMANNCKGKRPNVVPWNKGLKKNIEITNNDEILDITND